MEALSKPKTVWIPSLHSVFATNDQHLIIALPQHAAAKRNETSERGNTLSDFSKRLQLVQQDQDCLLQSIGPYGKAWWIANSALVMAQNTCVFYVQVLIYRLAHNQRGFSSACFLFLDNRCLLLLKGALVCRGQILQTSFGLVLSLFLGSCALFEHGELMCTWDYHEVHGSPQHHQIVWDLRVLAKDGKSIYGRGVADCNLCEILWEFLSRILRDE